MDAGANTRNMSSTGRMENYQLLSESIEGYKKDYHKSPDLTLFNDWIVKNYGGNTRTKTITQEKFQRICNLIRGDTTNTNAKFRFWVRNKGFRLIHYDESTGKIRDDPQGELYVSLHAREESAGGGNIESFLRTNLPPISFFRKVAVVEDFYDIIKQAHVDSKGQHAGQKKTYRLVSDTYAFLPREVITFYLLNCDACKPRIQKYGPVPKQKKDIQDVSCTYKRKHDDIYDDKVKTAEGSSSPVSPYSTSVSPYSTCHRSYLSVTNQKHEDKYMQRDFMSHSNVQISRQYERDIPTNKNSNFLPSLFFFPKDKNIADKTVTPATFTESEMNNSVVIDRPKSAEIPYLAPASRKSTEESFYNKDQLRAIEMYARERRKIFEQIDEEPFACSRYKAKRYTNYREHFDGPSPKYQRRGTFDAHLNAHSHFEWGKKRYEQMQHRSLDLYSPRGIFENPMVRSRPFSVCQGSVSSGSSDSTDEQKDEDDLNFYKNKNCNGNMHSPIVQSKEIISPHAPFFASRDMPFEMASGDKVLPHIALDYNKNITKPILTSFSRSLDARLSDHRFKSGNIHGIHRLLYSSRDKLY